MFKPAIASVVCAIILCFNCADVFGQTKKQPIPADTVVKKSSAKNDESKNGPKPYKDVITDKAKTDSGLFIVHKVEDKYYFEIADSLIGREWLALTKTAKVPTATGLYGGEEANRQTLRWEKGPDNKLFLRGIAYINIASDTLPISTAVKISNTEPIVAAFDIKALSKDSSAVVIEVTDFFKGDNPAVSMPSAFKKSLGLSSQSMDRSFINSMRSYPVNTEIRTTKTYTVSGPAAGFTPIGMPVTSLPTADIGGVVTIEVNVSMVMLPRVPMTRRFWDERVGYYREGYYNYGLDEQRASTENFIDRWRLEPKPEDVEKMKRGELVEPAKPIVYYIDPATPVKWRKYLKLGIEDWQKAFEQAGFKNAIIAKDWPEQDSSMSLEDVRFSVIRYFASEILNAYGGSVTDPRSGEMLQSNIGWYHNVMKLLYNWYLMQAGTSDVRAQKRKFDDALMGDLVRFVSSHEVGHTLGLPHNFGSSSTVPVEKLRDKKWVEANGHTPSIMDYARFNYVAQPEDSIGYAGLYPRIGDYDKWAIEWGYKPIFNKTEDEQKDITRNWARTRVAANPRLKFLRQRSAGQYSDPRAQNEDLSDNAIKASEYGIRNLKRILPNLSKWSFKDGEDFSFLDELYDALKLQLQFYLIHVSNQVGGIYENAKTYGDDGDVYTPAPKALQKDAIKFLNKNIFETPNWLLDWKLLKRFNQDQVVEELRLYQEGRLNYLLTANRMARMIESMAMAGSNNTYGPDDMLNDVKRGIWSEIYAKKPIDLYRRNLQKAHVERLITLLNGGGNNIAVPIGPGNPRRLSSYIGITQVDPRKDDISSILKAHLKLLKTEIQAALFATTDKLSRYHLQDVADRIDKALDPK